MRTIFDEKIGKVYIGRLYVLNKYNSKEKMIPFNIDSLIKWYPFNSNYSYYYSDVHGVTYLSKDSRLSKFDSYEISKVGRQEDSGILLQDGLNLECKQVEKDNYALCDEINNLGYASFINASDDLDCIEDQIKDTLDGITKLSVDITKKYEQKHHVNPDVINNYFGISLGESTEEEDYNYYLLGCSYTMLKLKRDILKNR